MGMENFRHYWNIFINGYSGYAQYLYKEILNPSWYNYFYWLIGISLFFFILELLQPWRKDQAKFRKDFWLDAFYMFFNFFIFSLIIYNAASEVLVEIFKDTLQSVGIKNLVAIKIQSWPVYLQLLILFVLRDFIQWWVHRLLHKSDFLWQFHQVHHSVKEMGFAAHLRYHWMETVVYRTLEYIPLAMIGFGVDDFFVVHIFALASGHFNHSNIRLPIGYFKYIFNNPEMHIWHHSKKLPKDRRSGVNFALTLSIWDYLFNTAYIPHDGKEIELGFPNDENFPDKFLSQATHGFSFKK